MATASEADRRVGADTQAAITKFERDASCR